jgi:putative MATE family efflux protein
MTKGTPWVHILKFSMPVLLGLLLQQLYNTVDAIVVGRFAGEASLSAVGTTGSFSYLFLAIATGFAAGCGVIIAQYFGAENEKQVKESAGTGIFFLMILGVATSALSIIISRPAYVHLIHVPNDYLELTLVYFRIYSLGLIFQFGYNIFSSVLRAIGDSAATLYFLLISSVINIVLDVIFVAVFSWGVAGAAVATVISQAASFIAAYFYMIKKYPIFRFTLSDYKWNTKIILKTIKIGLPMTLQLAVISIGLTLIQRAVNEFGQVMTASFTVGQRMEMYLNLPCNAFQTTLATYTGQNIGAGRIDRVKQGAKQTVLISLLITVIISIIVWSLADNIIELFGLGPEAAGYCLEHIRAVALINIVLSVYVPIFGLFQGAGYSILPMIVASCALFVRVSVTYLFRYSSFLGYSIVWWNGIFGFGIGFMVTWTFYLSGLWSRNKNNSIVENL